MLSSGSDKYYPPSAVTARAKSKWTVVNEGIPGGESGMDTLENKKWTGALLSDMVGCEFVHILYNAGPERKLAFPRF